MAERNHINANYAVIKEARGKRQEAKTFGGVWPPEPSTTFETAADSEDTL